MLKKFAEIAFAAGDQLVRSAVKILVSHSNPLAPLDLKKEEEKREAAVPNDHLFRALFDDLRVYERELLWRIDDDDTLEYTDLWSGDRPAVAGPRTPIAHSVAEVRGKLADRRITRFVHRRAFFPEHWIAKLQNGSNHLWAPHWP